MAIFPASDVPRKATLLVAESGIFQVVTFGMLHLHHTELDQKRLLRDVNGHSG